MAILLGGDPGDLPEALGPLYRLDDQTDLIAALPVFDERGLFPAEGSGPVEVLSDDTSDGEDSENAPRARLPSHRPSFCASLKMMMPPARSPR